MKRKWDGTAALVLGCHMGGIQELAIPVCAIPSKKKKVLLFVVKSKLEFLLILNLRRQVRVYAFACLDTGVSDGSFR